jgi:hypothetical protein
MQQATPTAHPTPYGPTQRRFPTGGNGHDRTGRPTGAEQYSISCKARYTDLIGGHGVPGEITLREGVVCYAGGPQLVSWYDPFADGYPITAEGYLAGSPILSKNGSAVGVMTGARSGERLTARLPGGFCGRSAHDLRRRQRHRPSRTGTLQRDFLSTLLCAFITASCPCRARQ